MPVQKPIPKEPEKLLPLEKQVLKNYNLNYKSNAVNHFTAFLI